MRHLTQAESRIVEALQNNGKPMKYADLRELSRGNHRSIKTLVEDGIVERMPMGLYTVFDPEKEHDTSFENFAALAIARPDAVICFDSAAAFQGLTVQNPSEIWAAFPYNSSPPRGGPGMEIKPSRWNENSMSVGVVEVEICGVQVKMTSTARTVVDFQRFARARGSEETAGEVLMSYAESGRMADLIKIARELGCERSIRPRLEMAQAMGRRR